MNRLNTIFRFYYEGFRDMTLGKTLWTIILIKLAVMFLVLKLLFFPDLLGGKSPEEKARTVLEELAR